MDIIQQYIGHNRADQSIRGGGVKLLIFSILTRKLIILLTIKIRWQIYIFSCYSANY